MDPNSGFNSHTKTFRTLKPSLNYPLENLPLSIASHALFLRATLPCPDSPAFIDADTGRRLLYSEFAQKTKSLASYLHSVLNLSKGDVAFVLSLNSIQVPVLYFSLLSIGVVISSANPLGSESDILHQINLSRPVIAFATSKTVHKIPELKHKPILIDSPEFELMMTRSSDLETPRVQVSQHDLAAILYSSGTTGRVKGVMQTHRNLITLISGYHAAERERSSQPVIIYAVPLFHAMGFFYCLKSVALNETVMLMERFELKKALKAVEDFRATQLLVAPPVVVALAKGSAADGFDLSSLELVTSGGAPLGKDVMAGFARQFPGVVLHQGYGLTETTGAVSMFREFGKTQHWGSVGRLEAFCEAKIVDPHTLEPLPPCKTGELWLRGPTVMKGYLRDTAATSGTLVSDGWLRTGDLCYINEEGFLFVVDRIKELIKYKGYQVPPAELENLLQSHPEIADAAVIPYPDEEAGQVPMAFVVRKHQSCCLNEADIMEFVAKKVAPYKKIRRVAFVNSIPKTAAGKILRRDLIKTALAEAPSKL